MIWLLFILCFLGASLLAGVESALLSVSRVRARHAASEGDKTAVRLAALLERRDDLVQAAIAANHLLSLVAFVFLAAKFGVWLGSWGIVLALVLAFPAFLIGLELVPKSLFRRYPFRLLKRTLPLLTLLKAIALPWRVFDRLFRAAKSGPGPAPASPGQSLAALVESIGPLNLLPQEATLMMRRFAAFDTSTASTLMEPLSKVSALSADLPATTAAQLARETGRRFHPVMDAAGNITGVFDASTLPASFVAGKTVRQFSAVIFKVQPGDSALTCLRSMRGAAAMLALVTDGSDGPEGVLSMDRLLAWISAGE